MFKIKKIPKNASKKYKIATYIYYVNNIFFILILVLFILGLINACTNGISGCLFSYECDKIKGVSGIKGYIELFGFELLIFLPIIIPVIAYQFGYIIYRKKASRIK